MANESKRHLFNNDVKNEDDDLFLDEQDSTNDSNEIHDEDGDGLDDNAIVKNINLKDEPSSFKPKAKNGHYNNFLSNNLIVENDENETNSYDHDNNNSNNFRITTMEMKEINNHDYQEILPTNKTIDYENNSDLSIPEHQPQIANTSPVSTTTIESKTISIVTKLANNNDSAIISNLTTTLPIKTKSLTESSTSNIDVVSSTTIVSSTDQNKNTTSTPNKGKFVVYYI